MCEQLTVRRDSTYSQVSASKKEMCKNETENATLYTGTFPAPPAPNNNKKIDFFNSYMI